MRDLIRPTLFLMARLGLFLAVVVWIVGQWWALTLVVPTSTHEFWLDVKSQGIVFHWNLSKTASWDCYVEEAVLLYESHFLGPSDGDTSIVNVGALLLARYSHGGYMAVRHWLIVTIFATFYGVLKWVYRKRGTEAVGDE